MHKIIVDGRDYYFTYVSDGVNVTTKIFFFDNMDDKPFITFDELPTTSKVRFMILGYNVGRKDGAKVGAMLARQYDV